MIYLPNEIINKIFSFLERPATNKIMNYVIEDCYKEDYCPYTAEYWYDNFYFHYSTFNLLASSLPRFSASSRSSCV